MLHAWKEARGQCRHPVTSSLSLLKTRSPTELKCTIWLNWLVSKTPRMSTDAQIKGKCCCDYNIRLVTLVLEMQTLAPLYYARTLPTEPFSQSSRLLLTPRLVTITIPKQLSGTLALIKWVQPLTTALVRVTTVIMKHHYQNSLGR